MPGDGGFTAETEVLRRHVDLLVGDVEVRALAGLATPFSDGRKHSSSRRSPAADGERAAFGLVELGGKPHRVEPGKTGDRIEGPVR